MKLTDENKKDILNSILEQVFIIADKGYQKRVWIEGQGPEVDSFDETADIFIEEAKNVLMNYKDFKLSESQYKLLNYFWKIFKIFAFNNCWPPEFIESNDWAKIMEEAKQILIAFNHSIPNS